MAKIKTIEEKRALYEKCRVSNASIFRNVKHQTFDEFLSWLDRRRKKQMEGIALRKEQEKAIFTGTPEELKRIIQVQERKTVTESDIEAMFLGLAKDEKFIPEAKFFFAFKNTIGDLSLEEARGDMFPHIPEEHWTRFVRLYFSYLHSNPEQIAVELKKSTDKAVKALQQQIDSLTNKQHLLEKSSEVLEFAKTIGSLTNQLANITSQYTKDLSTLGLVGGKVRGGVNIQIINRIPRPVDPFKTTGEKISKQIDIRTIGQNDTVIEDIQDAKETA